MISLDFASFSEQGPRPSNQDRLLEPVAGVHNSFLAAIADGVGGKAGGAEAAQLAIEGIRESAFDDVSLSQRFAVATQKLSIAASHDPKLADMSTTLSVMQINESTVATAHVGDTRVYHLRGTGIKTLTQDQTETAELVRRGILRPTQAKKHPRRNVLTSYLSAAGEFNLHQNEAQIEKGDRLILISDGAYNIATKTYLASLSANCPDIHKFIDQIHNFVKQGSPKDNYTCVVIQVTNVD